MVLQSAYSRARGPGALSLVVKFPSSLMLTSEQRDHPLPSAESDTSALLV